MQKQAALKIGLLINPIAGMGGKVGLHGTDQSLAARAIELGAKNISADRTLRAIKVLLPHVEKVAFYTASGSMGAQVLDSLGIANQHVYENNGLETSSEDTKSCSREFIANNVDLILFAGGDGTARDIFSVVGESIPILGIPSGVKMRSGVFANYPEEAAEIILEAIAAIQEGNKIDFCNTEILDLTDSDLDYSKSHYFGSARTFSAPSRITSPKVNSNASSDVALKELAKHLSTELSKERLYFFGPGRSAKMILEELGLTDSEHSLAGVDAMLNGQLIGRDLDEKSILGLLESQPKNIEPLIFLGVIGGQGFLLGRGNQQLSLDVMSQIGAQNIFVLASASKMTGTVPTRLYVDFEEGLPVKLFPDYLQVHVAKNRTLVCKVVSSGLASTKVKAS